MRADLTDEQVLLRETTNRFIGGELPVSATRGLHDDPAGFDRSWLRRGADLGWFAMLVPEKLGGGSASGAGVVDAALIAEAIGRHVQPGPIVPMNIVAHALSAAGTPEQQSRYLPDVVAGELVATWGFAGPAGSWDGGAGLTARHQSGRIVLDGVRACVQDGASADLLLLVADLDGAPVQVLVPRDAPGLAVRPLTPLDLSRRFADLVLDGVVVDEDQILVTDAGALDAQLCLAVALNLADTVGAVDALFSLTVAYAKDRIAFGRPIGSFQAIKHVLADQALHLETCKAGAVTAADACNDAPDTAADVVSMAAAYIGDVANDIAQECLQVHGGIGYTWEHDLHLYLRRVRSNAALYGEPTWHRERLCQLHADELDAAPVVGP